MTGLTALFVGDVSLDLTMTVSHVPAPDEKVHATAIIEAPGGVAANAAVACALAEAPTRLAIAIGDDLPGSAIIGQLASRNVDVRSQHRPGSTCRVVTLIEPHGEKRLVLYSGVSMYPSCDQLAAEVLRDVSWIHTVVYDKPAAETLLDRCRTFAIPWSLDLEPSTFPDGLDRLGRCIDGAAVVFCNARAIARIGGEAVTQLLGRGAKAVVETRGPKGATLHTTGGAVSVSSTGRAGSGHHRRR